MAASGVLGHGGWGRSHGRAEPSVRLGAGGRLPHGVGTVTARVPAVSVMHIEGVRQGHQSEGLRKYGGSFPERHCFTIVFKGKRKNLDLAARGEEDAQHWVQGLTKLMARLQAMNQREKLDQYPLWDSGARRGDSLGTARGGGRGAFLSAAQLDPRHPAASRQEQGQQDVLPGGEEHAADDQHRHERHLRLQALQGTCPAPRHPPSPLCCHLAEGTLAPSLPSPAKRRGLSNSWHPESCQCPGPLVTGAVPTLSPHGSIDPQGVIPPQVALWGQQHLPRALYP